MHPAKAKQCSWLRHRCLTWALAHGQFAFIQKSRGVIIKTTEQSGPQRFRLAQKTSTDMFWRSSVRRPPCLEWLVFLHLFPLASMVSVHPMHSPTWVRWTSQLFWQNCWTSSEAPLECLNRARNQGVKKWCRFEMLHYTVQLYLKRETQEMSDDNIENKYVPGCVVG